MRVPQFVERLLIQNMGPDRPVPYRAKVEGVGKRQVVVLATGGNPLPHPRNYDHQVTFTVWGKDASDETWAEGEAQEIVKWLKEANEDGSIGPVPFLFLNFLSLPYRDPDPSTATARYSFSARLHLRGREL